MKTVPLSAKRRRSHHGKYFAMVDDEDYAKIVKHDWNAVIGKNTIYAQSIINGKKTLLHRFILCVNDISILIDHKNHNGLDCQKHNIRTSTKSENAKNRIGFGESKYLGVSWNINAKKWMAKIKANGKYLYLGIYIDEVMAAKAYDKAAIKYHKEFANLNFNK